MTLESTPNLHPDGTTVEMDVTPSHVTLLGWTKTTIETTQLGKIIVEQPKFQTLRTHTTIAARSGQPALVGFHKLQEPPKTVEVFIVTATVLPAQASAKFSFRLVGQQNAEKILDAFRDFVRARVPSDCKVEFIRHGASPALQLPFSSEALSRARRALLAEWGKEPVIGGSGGSIPIVGDFKKTLGLDTLLIGFGLDDDCIHSPNEKYDVTSFEKGARSWVRVLAALAA